MRLRLPPFPLPSAKTSAWRQPLCWNLCWVALLLFCSSLFPAQAWASCPRPLGETSAPFAMAMAWDAEGRHDIVEVATGALTFRPLHGQVSAGFSAQVLWLRFCLPPNPSPSAETTRWLNIGPSALDDLSLFLPRKNAFEEHRGGDHLPFSARQWGYRQFAFAIPDDLSPNQPVYLRIASSSRLAPTITLWSEPAFRHFTTLDYGFYGLYLGAMALLLAFSLAFHFWLREPLYFAFAANIAASTCIHLLIAGFGSQFLYPEAAGLNDRVTGLVFGPVMAVQLWFLGRTFAVAEHQPQVHRVLQLLVAAHVLVSPLSLVMDWRPLGTFLTDSRLAIGIAGIPLVLYLGWKDRQRRAYVLAFVPWLAALLIPALVRHDWLQPNPLTHYSQEIGAFIHLTLLPILIARRTWLAGREKEAAQQQALHQAHQAEQELERRVARRTEDLEREVCERFALQEQLQEALATERSTLVTQRQFVAMLSHEFRTPLAIIDTTAQRLGLVLEQREPELSPRLGKIRRAVARLHNLLENCLAEDRLAAPNLALRREAVDLVEFLRMGYGERALQSARRIRLELPSGPAWVMCDRHLFDVALANLVDNALKYSPEAQQVTIRLRSDALPGMHLIQAEDRGPGVREGDRERIFDKYYRSDSGHRTSGAGLGLHLARDLIRRHGGDVTLAPTPTEGIDAPGATFNLSLPRDDDPPLA